MRILLDTFGISVLQVIFVMAINNRDIKIKLKQDILMVGSLWKQISFNFITHRNLMGFNKKKK